MNKEQIVREIINRHKKANDWLDKVPSEISASFFDNPYTENLSLLLDILENELLGNDLDDMVCHYMYEMDFGTRNNESIIGFKISNIDEFINYLKSSQFL